MEHISKKHYFDVDLAKKIGINASVIYENIVFWIDKNEANEKHFHDGLYWTYNSIKAFTTIFPYMSEKAIRNALKTLEEKGFILTGSYNKIGQDRTKWYALNPFVQKGKCNWSKGQMHLVERANAFAQKGEPLPYINTDIITDSIKDNTNVLSKKNFSEQSDEIFFNELNNEETFQKKVAPKKRFSIPTIEEVSAYCIERQNYIDSEKFHSHYTSVGWKVGKNPMKDWKAAVRTWEKNNNNKANQNGTEQQPQQERFAGRQSKQQVYDAIQRELDNPYDPRFRE